MGGYLAAVPRYHNGPTSHEPTRNIHDKKGIDDSPTCSRSATGGYFALLAIGVWLRKNREGGPSDVMIAHHVTLHVRRMRFQVEFWVGILENA